MPVLTDERLREARLSRTAIPLDPTLEGLVRKALADAWAQGADHETATEHAVAQLLQARLDMTRSDALAAVKLLREK
jgi:hypothetical protein